MFRNSILPSLRKATSSITIVSLFVIVLNNCGLAEESDGNKRVRASNYPLSVVVPNSWDSFQDSETDPHEVLFLQTPKKSEIDATVSLAAHSLSGKWDELVARQTYRILVFEGAPLSINESLTLRGAQGHKWVYKAVDPDGKRNLYYCLYLALPESVGKNRLLVMQGVAPESGSLQAVPLFNSLARTLTWGLQSDSATVEP